MKLLLVILVFCNCVTEASEFRGYLQNKFGNFIGDANLTATNMVTHQAVSFTATRSGNFNVQLSPGEWTILTDIQQVGAWGYAQLENFTVTMQEGQDTLEDIILFARIPLENPSLTISITSPGNYKFSMRGQGGTRFRLYRSINLQTWEEIFSTTIAKNGLDLTTNFVPDPGVAFFKLQATTD